MQRIVLAIVCVLAIIFVVPVLVYGLFTVVADLETPDTVSPARFLLSILVSKTGTAVAFVLLFYLARETLHRQGLPYALLWWLMFVTGEIGQAMGPGYSWTEALAGILSESIYIPLAAGVTRWIVREPHAS